jgi:hypothetical protein
MKDLKRIILNTIKQYVNEDNFSSFKGMLPYYKRKQEFIDSIKTFNDIDDDKIREILDYFGAEGYNDDEGAFDDFKGKVNEWKQFSNPQLLYRVIGVKNKKLIDVNNLGEHWTQYKWNLDGDMLMSIGYEEWDDTTKPYVIEALVPLSEIDVMQTIIQNLSFPNEHEVNLKNNGKNVKVVKSYKLKGF